MADNRNPYQRPRSSQPSLPHQATHLQIIVNCEYGTKTDIFSSPSASRMHSMFAEPQIGVASSSKNDRYERVLFLSRRIFTRHVVCDTIAFLQRVISQAFQLTVLLGVTLEEEEMALGLQIALSPVRIVVL